MDLRFEIIKINMHFVFFQPPNNEIYFEAVGNELGLEYFEIDEETGDVSVRKSLLTDPAKTKTYRVRISGLLCE